MAELDLPRTISVTLSSLAKMLDHALLHPTMTDSEVAAGLELSRNYNTATACVKPYSIPQAVEALKGSTVLVCPVIAFPHGNSTTEVKVFEAVRAVEEGGKEIDMVVNNGKVLGGDWDYVHSEIKQINDAVVAKGAILKVIFENDYLTDAHIIRLCEICSEVGVAFIKTSTGFGFVKQKNGDYNYKGATLAQLALMKKHTKDGVKIKAAGGVRTLDELIRVKAMGIHRVGTSSTKAILDEAVKRGIGESPVEVEVKRPAEGAPGSGY